MILPDFLNSLYDAERNFIASLDYGCQAEDHRRSLDHLIENAGRIAPKTPLLCHYEVVVLGKNWLQEGHGREFVACAAIVLQNIIEGLDSRNSVESSMGVVTENLTSLEPQHQHLLQPLLEVALKVDS